MTKFKPDATEGNRDIHLEPQSVPILEIDKIDVFYGRIQALRALSLQVFPGEMVALLGPNGAGKTTTLRAASGLITPTSGVVRIEGDIILDTRPHRLVGRVSHLPEGRELFSGLSVAENLRLGYWSRRKAKSEFDERLDWVLQLFPRLKERSHQSSGTLSGGEQQMLAMGRALMSAPRLLLVDELSLGLAPMIVAQIFEALHEVNRSGTAVLLVEQFVHMALQNTTRAYVLSKGEVVLEDESSKLLESPELMAAYLGEAEAGTVSVDRGKPKKSGKNKK